LLQFDQSVTNEEHDDVQQLNPDIEVLEVSENTATDNKSIEDISSAPTPTKKNDEVLTLVGDGSIDCSALQDIGTWPIRISDSFRDFKERNQSTPE
jgi:hypothetical protein